MRRHHIHNQLLTRRKRNRRYKRHLAQPEQNNSKILLNGAIINLSNHQLTANEISVLNKGLNFSIQPTEFNRCSLPKSTAALTRKLLMEDPTNPSIRAYTVNIKRNIQLIKVQRNHSNVTKSELRALHDLKTNPEFVIKPADKTSAVVLQNTQKYKEAVYKHLNDIKNYRKDRIDLTNQYSNRISAFLLLAKNRGIIDDISFEKLRPSNAIPGKFYCIPKLHKLSIEDIANGLDCPGRPICSSIGTATEAISGFLDDIIKPIVLNVSSYIKGSSHFLEELEPFRNIVESIILSTTDVEALYPKYLIKIAYVLSNTGSVAFRIQNIQEVSY